MGELGFSLETEGKLLDGTVVDHDGGRAGDDGWLYASFTSPALFHVRAPKPPTPLIMS
jgi:hypothetical protein